MKEFIGKCKTCGKELFCLEGFFNGVVNEDKTVSCFECMEQQNKISVNNEAE
ncbi:MULTISPECIES: hypothetical protein [unclassified Bacillus (in: firmicutes)]|uniref:hypothetical protein n=1 Tax=unclassified Bacillus (in: firmicutes) TaxID=185979 RepID=UPI0008E39403|nr:MULTISPECIES: hypothetical protein [unclassified Bacillus (in: firmicutes)]SFQ81494.1 hypothetical protein SAMN04488577_2050 [Bacillus sp. cl95]